MGRKLAIQARAYSYIDTAKIDIPRHLGCDSCRLVSAGFVGPLVGAASKLYELLQTKIGITQRKKKKKKNYGLNSVSQIGGAVVVSYLNLRLMIAFNTR